MIFSVSMAIRESIFTVLPRRMIAVSIAVLGVALWLDYPVFKPLLAFVLVVYGVAMLRWPLIWLAVLPACVPLLQLAHWSGRLFVEDLDIVFLFTLAILLWKGGARNRAGRLPFPIHIVTGAMALSYLASLLLGLLPWPDWHSPDIQANFLSQANALRLSKGFVWAMLLSPFVRRDFREHPDTARRMLIGGMLVGGMATGAMAFWERGVWQALLYGRDLYQLVGPLFDFSTPYRVTGTFAEMNTGGEAIDGYLGLAWPMMVLAVALARRPWALALSGFALVMVVYSLVTTFSRGLYLSLALAGMVWLLGLTRALHAKSSSEEKIQIWPVFLVQGVAALLMAYGYRLGGMPSLASSMLMFCVVGWVGWRSFNRGVGGVLFVVALAFCAWGSARGMVTSKWHAIEPGTAVPLALLIAGGVGLLGYLVGRLLPRDGGSKPFLVMAMIMITGAGTLVPTLLGYRMTERFSGVAPDFATRVEHWRDVLSLKPGRWQDRLLGMGLGSFPREYHWGSAGGPTSSGDFSLIRENGNTFIRTSGSKDLHLGQRVSLAARLPVHLSLRVRTRSPEAWLKIRLCRRFVIQPTEWNGQCVMHHFKVTDTRGRWQPLAYDFDTGEVGNGLRWGRPPLMLEISNRREYALMNSPPAVVDMDDVALTDAFGTSYVANGDFERGMDRWLPYYDFDHLPWHIKNIWVHLYFEQGALGVFAFAAGWLTVLGIAWQAAARGELFPVGLAAALTGFVAVGIVGSPIDAPRVAWLYYFLFFVAIAQYRASGPIRPHDKLRRRAAYPLAQTR